MSGFANPFAQLGVYKDQNAVTEDLVTTSYLTALPDAREIKNQHVALLFRTLLKRDTRTKQRALSELDQWLESLSSDDLIEDTVHLAYVQLYAKLSIDTAPLIRVQSHEVLAKLYALLGKRSSKYLKYTVGPWMAATNDPDVRAASAAKSALSRTFPGEKQGVLVEKMKKPILGFVYDSCANASANTLSDERYVSKEDASQKYTRLVKCCIDILSRVPNMFDLNEEEVESLVSSGRLWKFYSSSDSSLARSALQLTMAHVDDLEAYADVVWNELLRAGRKNSGGSGVAVEVVQLMNVFTKKYTSIVWPNDETKRKDALVSLSQFITADPPHPSRFWPLFYNLVLMVPDISLRNLAPLFKPLEKVVLKLKNDAELERSAWGCFISLSGKMGPDYVHRAFKTVEQRSMAKSVPIDILATFLARVANVEGVVTLVQSQLQNSKVPFEYCRVLAKTQLFRSQLESLIIPRMEPGQLVLLVEADPELTLPTPQDTERESFLVWVRIAAISNTVDSQAIIDEAVNKGCVLAVLENATTLSNKGVQASLDSHIPTKSDATTLPVLKAAVRAHGVFVSRETAVRSFKLLVQRALDDEENARELFRVIKENLPFISSTVASNAELRHDLETLSPHDRLGVLGSLSLDTQASDEHADLDANVVNALKSLSLDSVDLSVPLQHVNHIRAIVPLSQQPASEGLAQCEYLIESVAPMVEQSHMETEDITKLCILQSFAQHWLLVCLKSKSSKLMSFVKGVDSFLEITPTVNRSEVWRHLWELCESNIYPVAYHAAVALSSPLWAEFFSVQLYSRSYFSRPTLRGALIANRNIASSSQDYEKVQLSLVRRALTHNLTKAEWMLIDRAFIPENASLKLTEEELKDPELCSIILQTVVNVADRKELAFRPGNSLVQFSAITNLEENVSLVPLLEAAVNLPIERTNFDKEKGWAFFRVLEGIERTDASLNVIQKLLARRDSDFLPWMALILMRDSTSATNVDLHLDDQPAGAVTRADVASWLIYLNFLPPDRAPASHEAHLRILEFVARGLRQAGELLSHVNLREPKVTDDYDFNLNDCDGNLLYQMCAQHGSDVREWYRNMRDKQNQKLVDTALATYIVPELLRSIKETVESHPRNDEIELQVNQKQREIRASREVEDEFTVEVVISLPEQYPGKPATVEIRNLAGVSEAKKRGWLLEARQNIQNNGVLKALDGVLNRLNNFLEGVEPCAICYSTVNDANKLPNRECSQCHNTYHSECLYKWFSTNNDKLCPMCRSPM